jgi:hypothetical protein
MSGPLPGSEHGLFAKVTANAGTKCLEPFAKMARYGLAILVHRNINQIGVDNFISGERGLAGTIQQNDCGIIMGDKRLRRIKAPARAGVKHDIAVQQVVGQQDDGQGGEFFGALFS